MVKYCLGNMLGLKLFLNSQEFATNMYLSSSSFFQSAFLYHFLACFFFLGHALWWLFSLVWRESQYITWEEVAVSILNSPGVGALAKTMSHYFIKKIVEVIIIILTLSFVVIASNM